MLFCSAKEKKAKKRNKIVSHTVNNGSLVHETIIFLFDGMSLTFRSRWIVVVVIVVSFVGGNVLCVVAFVDFCCFSVRFWGRVPAVFFGGSPSKKPTYPVLFQRSPTSAFDQGRALAGLT